MYVNNLISVIIPIYNMESYLSRCLNSIINNSYRELEIICVNDGSCDDSINIIKEYSKRDSRVILIDKENGGVSSARNAGLSYAQGEYIAFIDPDDWIDVHYFEYLYRAIKDGNSDIALCKHQKASSDFSLKDVYEFSSKCISLHSFLMDHDLKSYIWGRIYKHTLISGIRFDEDAKIEDVLYNFTIAVIYPELRISLVDLPLYVYFIRSESLVSQIDENAILQLIVSYDDLYQKVESEIVKTALSEEIIKRGLSARYSYILKNDKVHIKECNGIISQALTQKIHKRLLYYVMFLFPGIYRMYRINRDKTLLQYEKNVKGHLLTDS